MLEEKKNNTPVEKLWIQIDYSFALQYHKSGKASLLVVQCQ